MPTLDDGYATPEEAAVLGFPPRYVTVLGTRIVGDEATAWLLTNDRPMFEPYTVVCSRANGRWYPKSGHGGIGFDAPQHVRDKATALGWTPQLQVYLRGVPGGPSRSGRSPTSISAWRESGSRGSVRGAFSAASMAAPIAPPGRFARISQYERTRATRRG